MLSLINKIITVVFTLIMINYCNGYITDTTVLSNSGKFTRERINTCEQFNKESSEYLINRFKYFVDRNDNYYALGYFHLAKFWQGNYSFIETPSELYNIKTKVSLGLFMKCVDGIIYFKNKFELHDIFFLKPVDKFIQPPELSDADKIETFNNCEDFDKKVKQVNTSGFLIFKNLNGNFFKFCMQQGCALKYYSSFELEDASTSFTDLFVTDKPFGFFWSERKLYGIDNSKLIYTECSSNKLIFQDKIYNPDTIKHYFFSAITFYNIKSQTETLEQVKSHLDYKIGTCKEFDSYLKKPINTLDGYIYFSDSRDETQPINYAMKVRINGPENLRERPYLLEYKQINHRHEGYVPQSGLWLFVSCQSKSSNPSFINDSLVFEQESNPNKNFIIQLNHFTFNNPSEDRSVIEARHKQARKILNDLDTDSAGKHNIEMKELGEKTYSDN